MEGFSTIFNDFRLDLIVTFPELKNTLEDLSINEVYENCLNTFPLHFFDILHEKDSLFNEDMFLFPNVNFSLLMNDSALSEKSKSTIWKYLQLILFYTLEKTNNQTFKNQEDIHDKMEQTIKDMKNMFSEQDISSTFNNLFKDVSNETFLNEDNIKNNLEKMMGGKIGKIAKELANEATVDMKNPEEFMKNLMTNPQGILGLVQNIGDKLETKLKDADLNDSDMMKEAADIMKNMGDIPGLKDMMSKMGMSGKMDMKGMMNKMEAHKKKDDTKDRMRKKMEENMMKKKIEEETMKKLMDGAVLEQNYNGDYIFKQEGSAPIKSKRKNKKSKNKKE